MIQLLIFRMGRNELSAPDVDTGRCNEGFEAFLHLRTRQTEA